jgi:hypothetical protein
MNTRNHLRQVKALGTDKLQELVVGGTEEDGMGDGED